MVKVIWSFYIFAFKKYGKENKDRDKGRWLKQTFFCFSIQFGNTKWIPSLADFFLSYGFEVGDIDERLVHFSMVEMEPCSCL